MTEKIPAYPKIFQVGSQYVPNLFVGPVEVTEKVDGSQFAFGTNDRGQAVMRSKGQEIFFEGYPKMFHEAVEFVKTIKDKLESLHASYYFYGEFLSKPKHNVLSYGRVPKNHIALFAASLDGLFVVDHKILSEWAEILGVDVVPLLHYGEIKSAEELLEMTNKESFLGKEKIEGLVVKNYQQTVLIGGQVMPSFGKLVRDDFKERHAANWSKDHKTSSKLEMFLNSFRSEARWLKAIQHLRDKGLLSEEPKDIGLLIREIQNDVLQEEELNIKQELYELYKEDICRKAVAGFPQYYKNRLAANAFEGHDNSQSQSTLAGEGSPA